VDTAALIADKISTFQSGYYFWIVTYGILGAGAIAGPGLAAMPVFGQNGTKVAAGIGAICAGLFGWLQPNVYATAFDVALKIAREVQISYNPGTVKPDEVIPQLIKAEDLTHFSYSGLQEAASRSKPP
jgi:hypothetical protein